jgi:hypothetical protein
MPDLWNDSKAWKDAVHYFIIIKNILVRKGKSGAFFPLKGKKNWWTVEPRNMSKTPA